MEEKTKSRGYVVENRVTKEKSIFIISENIKTTTEFIKSVNEFRNSGWDFVSDELSDLDVIKI